MAGLHSPEALPEPPAKRQRILSPHLSTEHDTTLNSVSQGQSVLETNQAPIESSKKRSTLNLDDDGSAQRETEVGILYYVNNDLPGFTGTFKQRYTDFAVNEIDRDGKVVHLTDVALPKLASGVAATNGASTKPVANAAPPTKDTDTTAPISATLFALKPEDEELLVKYFGVEKTQEIIVFHKKILDKPSAKPGSFGNVITDAIEDKSIRGSIHQDIRRIFNSRLDTCFTPDKSIRISCAKAPASKPSSNSGRQKPNQSQLRGSLGWNELGGEYLHFTLYKENKDTMEVISYLSHRLKVKPKDFGYSGTKDRRAITVQRISVFHQHPGIMAQLNQDLYGATVGNFKYERFRLELGDLSGNFFTITLRDCHFGNDESLEDENKLILAEGVVGQAVTSLKKNGFINYFGLQRFGTFGIGTDEVGKLILQGNFKEAVLAILTYKKEALSAANDPNTKVSHDDVLRARAIHMFETSGKGTEALDILPKKFSGEHSIIRHLSGNNHKNDYLGALLSVNRNLRSMYLHAYQSLVWNMAASERWFRHKAQVIEGDLVFVEKVTKVEQLNEVDENGEVVVHPQGNDVAVNHDDIFQRARPLSAAEAESGKYTIFDIVLPTPGFDINYPNNDIGDFYKDFMGTERGGCLNPAIMRRPQKDFSLSGSYRHLLAQVGNDMSFDVKKYYNDNDQLVETDLDRIKNQKVTLGEGGVEGESLATRAKIAVVLKFSLSTSCYATMVLRELGGIQAFKPTYSSGR